MRRIAFINEKGGTSKTTLAVNISAYFAREKGMRVLLVDMDSQGHAGKCLGIDVRELEQTVGELLLDPEIPPEQVIVSTRIDNLLVAPSNRTMADFVIRAGAKAASYQLLYELLSRVEDDYDLAVIDAPPSFGFVTTNIMVASTDIVVPVQLGYLAMDGCAEVLQSVKDIRAEYAVCEAHLTMVVPTFNRNTNMAKDVLATLQEHFGSRVSSTVLGYDVKIDEAQSHGQTIWEYAPKSQGAQRLAEVAESLYGRLIRRV